MSLRILILSPDPAVQGGVSSFIELLKRRLSSDITVDSFVIARRPNERGAIWTLLRVAGDLIRLMSRLVQNRYDLIHLNPSLNFKSVVRDAAFLVVVKVLGRGGVFVFFHGWDVKFEERVFSNSVYLSIFRWLFGSAQRVAVLSKTFRDALIGVGCDPQRIVVLPTMFDGDMFDTVWECVPTDAPRRSILFLSRFARDKGVYELLEAFARISNRIPELELVMAGDGEEADGIRQRAVELGLAGRVKFPGYVSGSDKARIFLDACVFVLPTYHPEGLPVALLEAMGAGAVIITAPSGGIGEVIIPPDNGIILEEITPEFIADALLQVTDDMSYVADVSSRNSMVARKKFESRIVTQQIESLYKEIAAEKITQS